MKALATVLVAVIMCHSTSSAQTSILAGWHDFSPAYGLYKTSASSKAADEYLSGVSASLYGGDGARNAWGSTDGTYGGTSVVETSSTDGVMSHRTDKPNMYITITNNTGSDLVLDSLVFDLASVSLNAPQDLVLYYDSGDLAVPDQTQINAATGVNANGLGTVSDYEDFDWSLVALSDRTLAVGECAVFRFLVANASNNTQALGMDNIAILGQGTPGGPLADAMTLLKEHLNGTGTLSAAEINTQAGVIETNQGEVGDTKGHIMQALDLVGTYETVEGALFMNSTTNGNGGFSRTDSSTANKALALAMLKVYQAIIDDVYHASNLVNHRSLLEGARFVSADHFPGAVAAPVDPEAVYAVQINASQPTAWGYPVDFQTQPARRPTGAYLAPGSFATITVPPALVNKGFQVRVGAHIADLKNKGSVKRIDRVSLLYDITSTDTLVANPLGGGIYIEVPYEVEEGLATVEIKNTVRSPFYSNTVARQTSLADWMNTERNHPGPWADFESDRFMMNVPTGWIYNYGDPVTVMSDWDDAMDVVSDMQGLPHVRPKTVLYCQIDVLIDAGAFSPGYPQSNDSYSPNSSVDGNKDHDLLNGPKFCDHVLFHELGHAAGITKFNGEVESVVNLLYVPVHNRWFGVSLDEAFGRSLNTQFGGSMNRKHAALNWLVTDKFRNGEAMDQFDMKYQHRGYGKYVEIAGLFGWEAVGNFWKSVAEDYENGITYSKNSDPADSRILRMSRAAGVDLSPLIHFWGVHPINATALSASIQSEGLLASALIYDRLVYYQSVVPLSAAEFRSHDNAIHNLIKDKAWYTTMRTDWTLAMGEASVAGIQEIIDLYFPNGRPVEIPVKTVPYSESFENGLGDWVQVLSDDYDWTINSGPTPTANTGPSGASDGSQYLYTEADDSGGSLKTTSVDCAFDLSHVDAATLRFDYHMFGADVLSLSVDVFDGASWTTDVWTLTGPQQNSSGSPWLNAVVDLTAYVGEVATVRFRAVKGLLEAGDAAIDNVSIEVPAQGLPYAESFENGLGAWLQAADDDYDWTVSSGYTNTVNTGPTDASEGRQYIYLEGHDNGLQFKSAVMECAFDLSTVAYAEMSFDYHMYGQYIDYLTIDVHDGTSWTFGVFTLAGQQQNSSASPWLNAEVNLSPYVGSERVTVRFRAQNKQWNAADMAIDNIKVEEAAVPPYDAWSATYSLVGGFDDDDDNDGMDNGLEFVLGGDPTVSDPSILPITGLNGTDVTFSYSRTVESKANTIQMVQWTTDFVSWNDILVDANAPDSVTIDIPQGNEMNGRLFVRLAVEKL